MKKKIVFLIVFLLCASHSKYGLAMEFDMLDNVDIHGFISQGYLKSTDNNFFAETEDGTPQFNEMGINFSTDITERLRMGVQFFARDMGTIGNNEVILDWAIADYRLRDWFGIRAGNLKFVNGLYNEVRDIDMLRTNIFLPQSVYNEAWRESSGLIQGAGIYGEVPMAMVGDLSYDAQYGTVNMAPDKGSARLIENQWPLEAQGVDIDVDNIDVEYSYTGSLKWQTPVPGLVLGGTVWGYSLEAECSTFYSNDFMDAAWEQLQLLGYTNTPYPLGTFDPILQTYPTIFTADSRSYTGSVEFTWRSLIVAAEYMRTDYEIKFNNQMFVNNPLIAASLATNPNVEMRPNGDMIVPDFNAVGYYGSIAYRFTYWFEMGAYYSEYYPNEDDKDGEDRPAKGLGQPETGWLKDTCLTLRFDITENWVAKLEGHLMDGAAVIFREDNPLPTDGSERYEEDWMLYAAKLTYSF